MKAMMCLNCGVGSYPPTEVCLNCGREFKSPPAERLRGDCRPGGESSGAPLLSTGTPYLSVKSRKWLWAMRNTKGVFYDIRTPKELIADGIVRQTIRKCEKCSDEKGQRFYSHPFHYEFIGKIVWPKKWVRS